MRTMIVKKYILLIITLISTGALADDFYFKGGIGINSLNPFKIYDEELESTAKLMHFFPVIEAGIGYNLSESIRIEAVFDYYFIFNIKETFDHEDIVADITRKVKVNALFINEYIDVVSFKKAAIFVGGGIGSSFQKEKVESLAITSDHYGRAEQRSKQINQFAYKLTAGIDFKLNDDLNLEIAYNYFDLGKNRENYKYRLHNITLGIRYAL